MDGLDEDVFFVPKMVFSFVARSYEGQAIFTLAHFDFLFTYLPTTHRICFVIVTPVNVSLCCTMPYDYFTMALMVAMRALLSKDIYLSNYAIDIPR